jgi:hypothetical protein
MAVGARLWLGTACLLGMLIVSGCARDLDAQLRHLQQENTLLRHELAIHKLRARGIQVDTLEGPDGKTHTQVSFRKIYERRKRSLAAQTSLSLPDQFRLMADLQGSVHVDLTATWVTDKDLESLSRAASITGLDLEATQVTDAGLRHVGRLMNLTRLNLRDCPITDGGLAHLRDLKRLQTLNLQGNKTEQSVRITDAGLAHLAGLKELRSLNLTCAAVTNAGMVYLTGLAHMKELCLADTQVGDDGLAPLAGMKNLERLNLWHVRRVTDAGLRHLRGLQSLRFLVLIHTMVTLDGVEGLKKDLPSVQVRLTNADPFYQ